MDIEGYLAKDTLIDKKTYSYVNNFNGKILACLTDKSDKLVNKLRNKKLISEKQLKSCSYSFKSTSSLSKMYPLPGDHVMFKDVQ